MAVVGYARVSSLDQNLARQQAALEGVDRLFEDKSSGRSTDGRPALQELLRYVREGDVVRVKSPDRLARSAVDLLNLVEELQAKGVAIEFVDQPSLNTNDKHGRFSLTVLAAFAELERAMIRERQAEGIALARERGVYRGRKPRLSPVAIQWAREQIDKHKVPKAEVARQLKVSRATLYDALHGRGGYRDEDEGGER